MRKNISKTYIIIALLASSVACYFVVGNIMIALDKRETRVNHDEGLVAINPQSILQLVHQDPNIAFTPISDSDYPAYSESFSKIEPVLWKQADYLRIATAFFQINWGDMLSDWAVSDYSYQLGCREIDVAPYPQSVQFVFHQVLKHDNTLDSRVERYIFITPNEGLLEWRESEYSPDFSSHLYFDLSQVKISAEEALQIAENNGGKDYRGTLDNQCDISVFLKYSDSLFSNSYDWLVYYSHDFSVKVDKQTGVYKINSIR